MTTALEEIIKDKIRQNGHMNMAEYMELCLGHPEYGYYMSRDPFGREGDFTTAPEISQMFGELIGAWLVDSWEKFGCPERFILLECGAGRGTLMEDALRVTKSVKGFHEAMQLHLLEMSPVLRAEQEKRLKPYGATWHMTLESLPTDSLLLILGNEFLDALPVRQLIRTDVGWNETVIKLNENDTLRLYSVEVDGGDKEVLGLIPSLLIPAKTGGYIEVSHQQKDFLGDAINIVKKQGGSILFIDYGFIHSVPGDTLQAVRNHEYCDVLESPGEVDITAHVNFAEISRLAMEGNMTVHGPVSQGDFLNRLGIGVRAQNLTQNATEAQKVEMVTAVKRLTGKDTKAGEMGELFKVIAFTADPEIKLAGFA